MSIKCYRRIREHHTYIFVTSVMRVEIRSFFFGKCDRLGFEKIAVEELWKKLFSRQSENLMCEGPIFLNGGFV